MTPEHQPPGVKLTLCGKYSLTIPGHFLAKAQDSPLHPHFVSLLNPRVRGKLSRYTWCLEKVFQQVGRKAPGGIRTVCEYFGGVGRTATIIQHELKPDRHVLIDLDPAQAEWLREFCSGRPGMEAHRQDFHDVAGAYPADLVTLNNIMTIYKVKKEPKLLSSLGKVFAESPRFVQFTEGGLERLHLFKDLYGKAFGTSIGGREDYLRLVGQFFLSRFNYRVTYIAHYKSEAALLLEPASLSGEENPPVEDASLCPESKSYMHVEEVATGGATREKRSGFSSMICDNPEHEKISDEPEATGRTVGTPDKRLREDLLKFARLEVVTRDLEPWALLLRAVADELDLDEESILWLVKLYNAYDSFASAWKVYRRWPLPKVWASAPDREDCARYECTQERRNLRGGKVIKHFQSYCDQLRDCSQKDWLRGDLLSETPADYSELMKLVGNVWGVGRQTAFEWVEFLAKVARFPISAPQAWLWESEGPRRSLQSLYGNKTPTRKELDDYAKDLKGFLAEKGLDLPWEDFETVICDFHVMTKGRYYVGRHLAALRGEIEELPPEDKEFLLPLFSQIPPEPWGRISPGIDKAHMPVYRDKGRIGDLPRGCTSDNLSIPS